MKILTALLLAMAMMAVAPFSAAADTPRGRLTGGVIYDMPGWFKKSFLALGEDVEEAEARGRHLMLFMHLAECPYCARLLDENFRRGDTKQFAGKHFDVVVIDIRGSSEVEWFDGKSMSERELAGMLRVAATPTMLFFDAGGKTVLRLNGYRQPRAMRQALEFVHGRHYRT